MLHEKLELFFKSFYCTTRNWRNNKDIKSCDLNICVLDSLIYHFALFHVSRIGGVMVIKLASSVVDRVFET